MSECQIRSDEGLMFEMSALNSVDKPNIIKTIIIVEQLEAVVPHFRSKKILYRKKMGHPSCLDKNGILNSYGAALIQTLNFTWVESINFCNFQD